MDNYRTFLLTTILFGFVVFPAKTSASFDVSLGYGAEGSEVTKLQEFLINQGYLNSGLATGNFLSLTENAVKAFQKNVGLEPIGVFGPKTRATANALAVSPARASISRVNVSNQLNSAAVSLSQSKLISWQAINYPQNAKVNINLIRKTSDSPASFTMVRQAAKEIENSGSYILILDKNETGNDLYVEITCSISSLFKDGCSSSLPIKVN